MFTNHPTIIQFIGYSNIDFQDENNITIIMQLAKNGSLYDVLDKIRNSNCPENYTNTTRQIILIGIARGMKYLHDRSIIHRDLKTGNVLLDDKFHPLITDFGLSKIYEAGHSFSQSQFGGTLSYMAPEIIKNEPYNGKVDVYAFGILMFEVVTETVSYPELEGQKMIDFNLLSKISDENYRPIFNVPVKKQQKELIEMCWSSNPDERPTFDNIFKKLTSKDEKEACRFDDVDEDEVDKYIEDVTEVKDNVDKLLKRIEVIESKYNEMIEANEQLNKQVQKQSNDKIEEENKELASENTTLKAKLAEIESLFASEEKEGLDFDIVDEVKKLQQERKLKKGSDIWRTKIEEKFAILAGGQNSNNCLGLELDNTSSNDYQLIIQPMKLPLDPSALLSFSTSGTHSVAVTKEGLLLGVGPKSYISSFLDEDASEFTEFCIKDSNGNKLVPISAACIVRGTIYMLSKSDGNGRQIIICDSRVNKGREFFVDVCNHNPVALFGGFINAAAICEKGEIIFFNLESLIDSQVPRYEVVSLPNGEKASSVGCGRNFVFVLSERGRVFFSKIKYNESILSFKEVDTFSCEEIVWISCQSQHCFAVTKDGRVFGSGSNYQRQLGMKGNFPSFRQISSLDGYEISAAFAGSCHSLFLTREGKVLSCGDNRYGELLLNRMPSDALVDTPEETVITDEARFCVLGCNTSAVFVGCNPPPNMPNTRVEWNQ